MADEQSVRSLLGWVDLVADGAAEGDGVTNDSPALQRALDRATTYPTGGVVFVASRATGSDYLLGTNVTVPANVELQFAFGARMSIATGITLTILGTVSAPARQIFKFYGTGAVAMASAAPATTSPRWFGAVGDGATDDASAMAQVIAAIPDGGIVDLEGANYRITSRISFTAKSFTMRNGTITFINNNAGGQFACSPGTNKRLVFDHVTFQGTPVRPTNNAGSDIVNKWLDLRSFECLTFSHCRFTTSGFTTTNAVATRTDVVYLRYNTEVVFENIVFENMDCDGLLVIGALDCTAPAGRVSCLGSLFKIADTTFAGSGLNLANVKDLVFEGNRTIQATRVNNTSSGHNLGAEHAVVSGNLFRGLEKGYDLDLGAAGLSDFIQYQRSHVCSNNDFIDCRYGLIANQETGDASHASTLFGAYDMVVADNLFQVNTAISDSFGAIIKPGRSTTIKGNTFSRMSNGLQLDFEDTLANDPNGGAGRSPLIGEYIVKVSGNVFDNCGVSGGNYGVAVMLTNMVDGATGLSRFNVSFDDNTWQTYPSASSAGLVYMSSLSNTSRMSLSFKNNKFYHIYSLVTTASAYAGDIVLDGNLIDTDQTNAQVISTLEANPILLTPHTIRCVDNHVKLSGVNSCLVLNENVTGVGGGPARYQFIDNLVELFSGYTDTSNLGPLLRNNNQGGNYYSVEMRGNDIINVSAVASAIGGIYVRRPKTAVIADNYVYGCPRGINISTWNDFQIIDNVVEGATTFGFAVGTKSGSGTVDSGLLKGNKTVDVGGVLVLGFDCSGFQATDPVLVEGNLCLSASGTKMNFGSLPTRLQINNRIATTGGRTTGVTGAIATGATVAHNQGTTPTVVLVTAVDSGPTNVYVSSIGASTFVVNYGGGGTHAFAWSAE